MSQEHRKPNVGSDATKGARVRLWQRGLYAFAIGLTASFVIGNVVWIASGKFSVPAVMAALVLGGVTWTLLTAKSEGFVIPAGVKVTDAEPELRAFVDAIAVEVAAPTPTDIFLVAEAEIRFDEATQFFGLKFERSVLRIGMPFLHALTRQELAAVVARELAPHGQTPVGHGATAVRGLRAARELIAEERKAMINGVYGSYARKMFRSVGGVGVAQEVAAEHAATEAYGSTAMLSALSKYDDTVVAFDQLLRDYVVPALQHQNHPLQMFKGFGELLKSTHRAEARQSDVERRQAKQRCEFELHHTPAERLDSLRDADHVNARVSVARSAEPAFTLLDPVAMSCEIVTGTWACKLMSNRTEPATWQQLTDEIYSAKTHKIAVKPFAAKDELDPVTQLETALSWCAAGDWHAVDGALAPNRRAEWVECVVTEAAATEDGFCWQHSWDGLPVLVDAAGSSFDADRIASLIVAGKAGEARTAFEEAVS